MKKIGTYLLAFLFAFNIYSISTKALSLNSNIFLMDTGCNEVLGSPTDPESTYVLLQQVFTVMKFAAPLLVLIFSIIEFMKAVASQDKDILQKAIKHTVIRGICGVIVFMVPLVFDFVFELLGWYGTCGIG